MTTHAYTIPPIIPPPCQHGVRQLDPVEILGSPEIVRQLKELRAMIAALTVRVEALERAQRPMTDDERYAAFAAALGNRR